MADLTETGASWLAGKLKNKAARTVEYRRGTTKVSLSASRGSSLLKLGDELAGVRMERTDADWIFTAADLAAGGISLPPQRGDVVADTVGAVTTLYEVRPFDNQPPFRYMDPHELLLRVHTKKTGTE